MSPTPTQAHREAVTYRFDALNWNFIKLLAEIAQYADDKYGRAENYVDSRLDREKAPLNHLVEHYRAYLAGEPHDHFTDPVYHLAAIAYNAMMEYYYHVTYGHTTSELTGAAQIQVAAATAAKPTPPPPPPPTVVEPITDEPLIPTAIEPGTFMSKFNELLQLARK